MEDAAAAAAPPLRVERFRARDGVDLAYREVGEGRPLVLLHGFISNAVVNWVSYGHAALLAARGRRVVMPDLRGHGDSARPHDPWAYPPDVLAADGLDLLDHLGLRDYDLGGYSLGARIAVRMVVHGATPGRAVLGGTGLEPLLHARGRGEHYRRALSGETLEPGSREWAVARFVRSVGGDPVALLNVLETLVDTSLEELRRVRMPCLVVAGSEDGDHGSVDDLASALPDGRVVRVPGDHMTSVGRRELGEAMAGFLETS